MNRAIHEQDGAAQFIGKYFYDANDRLLVGNCLGILHG